MVRKQINNKIVPLEERQLSDINFHVYLPELNKSMKAQNVFVDKQEHTCNDMNYFGGDKLAVRTS